ncbi:RHS repeat-associated core domain-containing protein [Taibaiella koreensis]|uniref:hypothetical protein n=1 Tax=Taibaiella koreensis TaxID=1268548 RepID=UPI0013C2C988|nr:hypothetical protein [Taibaiella koreensis]
MHRFITMGLAFTLLNGLAFAGDGNKEVLTLSKGKYVEIFDQDSTEQVGNIIYNINSGQIVGFAPDQEITAAAMPPEIISRWLQIDPLAAKYPSISPYAYCANNPILFVDPDGAELIFHGDAADVNATVQRMQSAVGGSYTVAPNSSGSIVMTPNASFSGTVSTQQQAAIDAFLPITSLETGKTTIGIVRNSDEVNVGNFKTGQIDIGDVEQYDNIDNISGSPTALSGNGKLIHEANEQFQKQANGMGELDAHNSSIDAENKYNGSTRQKSVMDGKVMISPDTRINPTGDKTTEQKETRMNASNGKPVIIQETYQMTGTKKGVIKENLTGVTQMP